MDAEFLLGLAPRIAAREREPDALNALAEGLAELPAIALAQVWLLQPGDLCQECSLRDACHDQSQCLHLMATAGSLSGIDGSGDGSVFQSRLQRIPLSYKSLGKIAETGGTDLIKNVSAEGTWRGAQDGLNSERIQEVWAHALVSRGKPFGVLALFSREPLSDRDSDLLKNFTDQTAIAITNARALEEVKRAELGLRQIVNVVRHHLTIIEPGMDTVFANRAAREYFDLAGQYPPQQFLEMVTHPDDVEKLLSGLRQAMAAGRFFETEARMRGQNGKYRWFLYQLHPLEDERGQIFRWCSVRTDIEEQKRAQERTQRENLVLREEVAKLLMSEEIVGTSPALLSALSRVARVASADTTVLITGETGTGKELVARAIHRRSNRAERAFVSVNCAAIPKELIPSELFGHEKGAFTGALARRLGRFELAEGGTIFLDEIGELPIETQIALLRVLQEREFQRVGSNRSIPADVRIIAATHRDLPAAIEAGVFRTDLFYRINVFPIHIPPLRERKEDIRLLVEYFIHRFASRNGKQFSRIDEKSMERLERYPWPGNIRELQNVIERSAVVCEADTFSVDESWVSEGRTLPPLPQTLITQEKEMIEMALAASKGRISGPDGAASKLRIPRSTLESRIKSLKIDKRRFQEA